jgi:hypothetical protein
MIGQHVSKVAEQIAVKEEEDNRKDRVFMSVLEDYQRDKYNRK